MHQALASQPYFLVHTSSRSPQGTTHYRDSCPRVALGYNPSDGLGQGYGSAGREIPDMGVLPEDVAPKHFNTQTGSQTEWYCCNEMNAFGMGGIFL